MSHQSKIQNGRLSKRLILTAVAGLATSLGACQGPSGSELDADEGPKGSPVHEELLAKRLSEFKLSIKPRPAADKSAQPAVEKGHMAETSDSKWDANITMKLGADFAIVNLSATNTVSLAVTTQKTMHLLKPNNDILSSELVDQLDAYGHPLKGPDGKTLQKAKLVTGDGQKFQWYCTYLSKNEESVRYAGAIKVSAGPVSVEAGVGNTNGWTTLDEVESTKYDVTPHDTFLGILDTCVVLFASQNLEQVKTQLENALRGASLDEAVAASGRARVITAALHGPKADRVKVDNHDWNAPKANIDNSTPGVVKVSGTLEHSIAGQNDDFLRYDCTIERGNMKDPEIKKEQRSAIHGGWEEVGKSLIKDICHDAFMEFGKPVPVKPIKK